MPVSDLTLLFALSTAIAVTTLLTEWIARRGWLPQRVMRKLLHFVAVGCCALAALWIADRTLLTTIVAPVEVVLLWLVGRGVLFAEENGRRAWGIALFPLAFLVLLQTNLPNADLYLAMLILAVSDPLAALVGKTVPLRRFNWTGDPKSLGGSSAFAAATLMLLLFQAPAFLEGLPTPTTVFYAVLIAGLLTLAEALGSKGWDNVFIPLAAALLWRGLPQALVPPHHPEGLILLGIAIGFAGLSSSRRWLTPAGAITAGLFGWSIVTVAGPGAIVPPLLFFASSIALGRWLGPPRGESDAKQGQARDATQVLANGGVYWLLVLAAIFWSGGGTPTLLFVSMAIATADTWASEIGIRYGGPTYDLLRWRRLPVGVSGGVSLVGTLGGLAGSGLIALSAYWLAPEVSFGLVLWVGFAGMLVDSLLGAALQIRYRNAAGQLSDRGGPGTTVVAGYRWVGNDTVNLLTNFLVTALCGLGLWLAIS
jgi:uncharacterized protein (TIGR00297 family)